MSLSSAAAVNAITGFIAKKSAALAAASGAVLASAGIILAAHGVMLWNNGMSIAHENQRGHEILSQKRLHLAAMERSMQRQEHEAALSNAACSKASACQAPIHTYHQLYKTMRAIQVDLPHWAVQNGIKLSDLQGGPNMADKGQPLPGYPGISQSTLHISGAYGDLEQLQDFFRRMPTGIELTGIHIKNQQFTAEITAYGLNS